MDAKLKTVVRVDVLHVPVDVVDIEDVPSVADEMLESEKVQQIVFVRLWDLIRARVDRTYRLCLIECGLVVPVSRSILWGARTLQRTKPFRHLPFDFVIRLLAHLESRGATVYLVGGRDDRVLRAERNIKRTFPGLRIVGRAQGYLSDEAEVDVVTAIRKATPDVVLGGPGLRKGDIWMYGKRKQFGPGIFIWSAEIFNVFSERAERPSREAFRRGTDVLGGLITHPWRVFRGFPYLWYVLAVLVNRIRHR